MIADAGADIPHRWHRRVGSRSAHGESQAVGDEGAARDERAAVELEDARAVGY